MRKSLNAEANKCDGNILRNALISHKTAKQSVNFKHLKKKESHPSQGEYR